MQTQASADVTETFLFPNNRSIAIKWNVLFVFRQIISFDILFFLVPYPEPDGGFAEMIAPTIDGVQQEICVVLCVLACAHSVPQNPLPSALVEG